MTRVQGSPRFGSAQFLWRWMAGRDRKNRLDRPGLLEEDQDFARKFLRRAVVKEFRAHFERELDLDFFQQRYAHILPPRLAACSAKDDALFLFYLSQVREHGLDPNRDFSERQYLAANEDVGIAVEAGTFLCGFHHFVLHGRKERRRARRSGEEFRAVAAGRDAIEAVFDSAYYAKKFMPPSGRRIRKPEAVEHFLQNGLGAGVVPVPAELFDEDFYTAYYEDVYNAKRKGDLPSGYYHYVVSGMAEGRSPTHDLRRLLEAKLGELAVPSFQRLDRLRHRLRPVPFRISAKRPPVYNIFIPTLDPNLIFGGYIAFFHFLCRLAETGLPLRFLVMEDGQSNRKWFLRGIASRPRWAEAFAKQEILNLSGKKTATDFSEDDVCFAYSCWTMHDAWSVARSLRKQIVLFFIQEYEPIFHELDSFHFIANAAYQLPHAAIFNSRFLVRHFEKEKIGVFAPQGTRKYLHFEHAIGNLSPDMTKHSAGRARKRLLCYARPEKHAGRNLFEVCVMALSKAIEEGVFDGEWEFTGIGSICAHGPDHAVDLGGGFEMKMMARVEQGKYESLLQSFDVGLSLMWAPHPGVVHFEMAKAGIVTVTNIFGERTAEALSGYGHNIVPCAPSLAGIVAGLRTAVRRSSDLSARTKGCAIAAPADWDQVFDGAFFERLREMMCFAAP